MVGPTQLSDTPLFVHPNNSYSVSPLFDKTAGDNELHTAIRENQVEKALSLIRDHINLLFKPNEAKLTPLHLVCGMERKHILEGIIKIESEKNAMGDTLNWGAEDQDGKTSLHYAALSGQLEGVKLLVSKGLELRKVDKNGNQSLHLAAKNGHAAVVKYICESHGIQLNDLRAKNLVRHSAYRLAERSKHTEVMSILAAHNAKDNFQQTLNLIYSHQPQKLAALLTEDQTLLTDYDVNQNSLMHHAVLAGGEKSKSSIPILFEMKMSLEDVNEEGKTPLCIAAKQGNLDALETLISLKANVRHVDKEGYTALHRAAAHNHVHIIKLLVENGISVDFATAEKVTALHIAIACKRSEAFNELVRCGANVDQSGSLSFIQSLFNKMPPPHVKVFDVLWLALETENDAIIKAIIDLKIRRYESINVDNTLTFNKDSLLHYFARAGDLTYFKKMLCYSKNFFEANASGMTPLHFAAQNGHAAVVKYICESYGVQLSHLRAKNLSRDSAYRLAERNKHTEVMSILAAYNAKDNFQRALDLIYSHQPQALKALLTEDQTLLTDHDANQNSLMHHAVLAGGEKSKSSIPILFEMKMSIEGVNEEGKTPLCVAATQGNCDALEILISLKANVRHVDKEGYTALHHAAAHNHVHIIKSLVKNGVSVDFATVDKITPLHIAIGCKRSEAFNELVRCGANVNQGVSPSFIQSRLNKTPPSHVKVFDMLWLALETENDAIIKAIIDLKIRRYESINVDNTLTFNKDSLLHYFANRGDLTYFKKMLCYSKNSFEANASGMTPLHFAAQNGHATVVKYICESYGVQLSHLRAKNLSRDSAYRLAERNKHTEVMSILASYNAKDNFQRALELIYSHQSQALKALLTEDQTLLTDHDANQNSLMHHAVLAGGEKSKSSIPILFEMKMPIESVNEEGKTPLCIAAGKGNCDALEILISLKANVHHVDKKGCTALHQAATHNHENIIKILIKNGIYVDFATAEGETALHVAAAHEHVEAFNELIRCRANSNLAVYPSFIQSRLNKALPHMKVLDALWLALEVENDFIIRTIIDLKIQRNESINVDNTLTFKKESLLHYFARTGNLTYFKKMLGYSYYPFTADVSGLTPLHYAAKQGHMEIAREILENVVPHPGFIASTPFASFDIEAKSQKGETAWWLAKEHKQPAMMEYLVSKGAKVITELDNSKSTFQKASDFVTTQNEFSAELEQTWTFFWLNNTRMAWPVIMSYPGGPIVMGITLCDQVLTYATYPMMNLCSSQYYKIKYRVHNHAHWTVESGLDGLATVSSWGAKVYRVKDWIISPTRRMTGSMMSYLSANLAARYTDNKEVQAFSYFCGREAGMLAVDGYQQYAKNLENSSDETPFDYEFNKALTIWSSLLGKENGEKFAYTMHVFTQVQNDLYQMVGWAEHVVLSAAGEQVHNLGEVLNSFESYQNLMQVLQLGRESLASGQWMLEYPLAFLHSAGKLQRDIANFHQQLIHDLEDWINENWLPESEYRTQVILYSMQLKLTLLSYKTAKAEMDQFEAKIEFDAAEEALKQSEEELNRLLSLDSPAPQELIEMAEQDKINAQQKLNSAKEKLDAAQKVYDDLVLQGDELRKATDDIFNQTPKGIETNALNEALKNEYEAQVNKEIAETQLAYQDQLEVTPEEKQEAEDKLKAAEDELAKCKTDLEAAKERYFKVATSLEKENYEKNEGKRQEAIKEACRDVKSKVSEHYEAYIAFTQAEKDLYDAQFAKEMQEYEYASILADHKAIENSIYLTTHPTPFVVRTIVHAICQRYSGSKYDAEAVTREIIEAIVATGIIDETTAKARMEATFNEAQQSRSHRYEVLVKRVSDHWLALHDDEYRSSLVARAKELQPRVDEARAKYQEALKNFEDAKSRLENSKNDYKNTLGDDEKIKFESQYQEHQAANEEMFWKAVHSDENNLQILAIVGQPGLMIDFLGFQKHNVFKCEWAAKWLISYKYLFLPAPDLDTRLAEEQALAEQLMAAPLTIESLLEEKTKIDNEIANGILASATHKVDLAPVVLPTNPSVESEVTHSTVTVGSEKAEISSESIDIENEPAEEPTYSDKVGAQVVADLQKVMPAEQVNSDWEVLESTLSNAMGSENKEAANEVIVTFLQENTCAISIDKYEKWEAPKPAPAPMESTPPKKKYHGWNKVWHKAKDIGKAILAAGDGVGLNINTNGALGGGFNNQPPHLIYDFGKPKPSPMQQSLDDWSNSLTKTPSFYTPPSYASKTPHTASSGPTRVSEMPAILHHSEPVLPLNTFMPSLAPPPVSVPLALPVTPTIPLRLPEHSVSGSNVNAQPAITQIQDPTAQVAPSKPKPQPQPSKPEAPKPVDVPVIENDKPDDQYSTKDKIIIGVGHHAMEIAQGIKGFLLTMGEDFNLVEEGMAAAYAEKINEELRFYEQTPVGKSLEAKIGEMLVDVATFAVPGTGGAKFMRLLFGKITSKTVQDLGAEVLDAIKPSGNTASNVDAASNYAFHSNATENVGLQEHLSRLLTQDLTAPVLLTSIAQMGTNALNLFSEQQEQPHFMMGTEAPLFSREAERPTYSDLPERPTSSTREVRPSYLEEVLADNMQATFAREEEARIQRWTSVIPEQLPSNTAFPIHQEPNRPLINPIPEPIVTGSYVNPIPGPEIRELGARPLSYPAFDPELEELINRPYVNPIPDEITLDSLTNHAMLFMYNRDGGPSSSNSWGVELYRVVTRPEYEQIRRTGNFQGIGNNAKYFTRSLEEAEWYANEKERMQDYVIVSTRFNGRITGNSQANVDGGIRAVVLNDQDLFKLTCPVIIGQDRVLNEYIDQANGSVMKLPGGYTGLTYNSVTQKISNGAVSDSSKVQVKFDQKIGQMLLDSAYVNPMKPGQLFNYHNGQVLRFTLTSNDVWEARIINQNVQELVGSQVLRSFRNDGLISNAEYKALLKM